MKHYIAPVAELLLLTNEDVLTSSDNALGDIFFENKTNNNENA